jgi:DNA gyrase/topoisomerase IV subunit A
VSIDQIPVRSIDDFFDNEYRDYAVYVVEGRAIPSLIDGLKPSQRKIAYAANRLWKTGNEKPMKVFQLGGQAAAISFFHHGSLDGTIIGMTQEFKNSMPIFQGIGQFGSLRSPVAGAPRYIGVKFNENFKLLYKDFELTTPKYEEGEEIEPQYFLPIIPTVLLNGGSGIAVGFATKILNRHPVDLIDACMCVLKDEPVPLLVPWIKGFKGHVERVEGKEKSWNFRGEFSVKNTTTVEITEIPPSYTYEKYEQHLESLVEKGTLTSYEDNSSEKVHYILKFSRATLAKLIEGDKLPYLLKMRESEGEILTTLDENGQLKIFDRAEDIVTYFVNFRLGYYEKRKERLIKELTQDIEVLDAKSRFIEAIINGSIIIANEKKANIISSIESLEIPKQDKSYDYLLSMPLWSLTQEKYQEFQKKLKQKESERKSVQKTSASDFYKNDLLELRSKVERSCGK